MIGTHTRLIMIAGTMATAVAARRPAGSSSRSAAGSSWRVHDRLHDADLGDLLASTSPLSMVATTTALSSSAATPKTSIARSRPFSWPWWGWAWAGPVPRVRHPRGLLQPGREAPARGRDDVPVGAGCVRPWLIADLDLQLVHHRRPGQRGGRHEAVALLLLRRRRQAGVVRHPAQRARVSPWDP